MRRLGPPPSHRSALGFASALTLVAACGNSASSTGSLTRSDAGEDAGKGPIPTSTGGPSPTGGGPAPSGTGGGPGPTGSGGAPSSTGGSPAPSGTGGGPVPTGGGPVPSGSGGGPTGTGGGPANPTRLEDWSLAPDGTQPLALGSWKWDTREKVHCRFVTAEDDKLRCLPDAPRYLVNNVSVSTDPKCKEGIWGVQKDGDVDIRRPWVRQIGPTQASSCAPPKYQVLRPLPAGTQLYFSADGTNCKPYKPAADEIAMVPLVPDAPDKWELGTPGVGQLVSARLHVADVVTSDGAHFADHVFDDRLGMSCALAPFRKGGGIECAAAKGQTTAGFSDATCMVPLEVAGVGACQPVPAFVEDSLGARFTVGAPFVGSLYRKVKQPCDLVGIVGTTPALTRAFLKGDPLPADAIASVTEAAAAGTGRFRLRGLAGPNNAAVPLRADLFAYTSHPFFDSVANEECQPAWTPDGKVRCIPASIPIVTLRYFADGACKRLTIPCDSTASCAARKLVFGQTDAYGRTVLTDSFAGGAPLAKTNLYYLDGTTCVVAGSNVEGQGEATGTLPWDTFPALPERNPLPPGL